MNFTSYLTESSFCNNGNTKGLQSNATEKLVISPHETYLQRSLGFLIIGCIGIISNVFAISILSSLVKIRQKLVNSLIIHQSFVDTLASLALVGTAHIDGLDPHGLEGVHADIYCFLLMAKWPLWVMMNISSFSLVFMNIERYISIVFPIYHHVNVTRKKVLLLLPIMWFLGISEQCLVSSFFHANNGICSFRPSYRHLFSVTGIISIVFHFFLPLILVVFLYGHMIVRLRKTVQSKQNTSSTNRNNVMDKARKNVFKTMLLITICYAVCYVCNSIYIALFLTGILNNITGKMIFFSLL